MSTAVIFPNGAYLGNTFATTNSSITFSGQDLRHAYGRYRGGHELGTENRFTTPKGPRNWMASA